MIRRLTTLPNIDDYRPSAAGYDTSNLILDTDLFQLSLSAISGSSHGQPVNSENWGTCNLTYSQLIENLSGSLNDGMDLRSFTLTSDGTNPISGDSTVVVGKGTSHVVTIKTIGDALTLSGSNTTSTIYLSGTDKFAIVPSRSGGFVSLACVEMPETRFEDVIRINVNNQNCIEHRIDEEFLFVCEKDTIDVISCVPSEPAMTGARISDGKIIVKMEFGSSFPEFVTVKISGIRKGRLGKRFVERTAEEAFRNTQFWSAWEIKKES